MCKQNAWLGTAVPPPSCCLTHLALLPGTLPAASPQALTKFIKKHATVAYELPKKEKSDEGTSETHHEKDGKDELVRGEGTGTADEEIGVWGIWGQSTANAGGTTMGCGAANAQRRKEMTK